MKSYVFSSPSKFVNNIDISKRPIESLFTVEVIYNNNFPREFVEAILYDGTFTKYYKDKDEFKKDVYKRFQKGQTCVTYDVYKNFGGLEDTHGYPDDRNIVSFFYKDFRIQLNRKNKSVFVKSYFIKDKSPEPAKGKVFIVDFLNFANIFYEEYKYVDLVKMYNDFSYIDKNLYESKIYMRRDKIISHASLIKFMYYKLGIRRVKLDKEILDKVMFTYYGPTFEVEKENVHIENICSLDMKNAFISVSRLMKLWDYYCHKISYKQLSPTTIQKYLDNYNCKDFYDKPIFCKVAFKEANLPIRYRIGDMYSMNNCIYSGVGWYHFNDILASKIYGYKAMKILDCFTFNLDEPLPIKKKTFFGLEFTTNNFMDKMFELLEMFSLQGKRNIVKNMMVMIYGASLERFGNKGGYFFNPIVGSSITAGIRLNLAIIKSQTKVYSIMCDNVIIPIEDKEKIMNLGETIIPFKEVISGNIYIVGIDKYFIYNEKDKKYSKHILGIFDNLDDNDIEAIWDAIVEDKILNDNKAVVRIFCGYNKTTLLQLSSLTNDFISPGEYIYITINKGNKVIWSKSIEDLEKCNSEYCMRKSDLPLIFTGLSSNKITKLDDIPPELIVVGDTPDFNIKAISFEDLDLEKSLWDIEICNANLNTNIEKFGI